jgi:hypothetical protein
MFTSSFFKSAGISCTTPLEIFFCDTDGLSFRKLQGRGDLLLSKGCEWFGHGEVLRLRLTQRFDYPLRSFSRQAVKFVIAPIGCSFA